MSELQKWKDENEGMIAVADAISRGQIGHNNPPDPIETVLAEYDGIITEAQNWADGQPVENEAQMTAVDKVLKEFKAYKTALGKAGKERTDPLHKAWKAEVAAVKVYTDDADKLQGCLVACVAPYKAKLAAEKEEARKQAAIEAARVQKEAQEAAAKANAADIDAQREAEAKLAEAKAATEAAAKASKDTVKGMRTVKSYVIDDHKAALHWIAAQDRAAMTAFIEEYVRRNFKTTKIDGVTVTESKEAY